MTHRGDTRFAHAHTPALPSCSQIACCIDVDTVNINKTLCVRVHVHCMSAPCPCVSIVRACPASSCTCPVHTYAQALFVRGCHASFVCIDLSPRLLAHGLLGGVYTDAPAHVGTCVPVLCKIQQTLGADTLIQPMSCGALMCYVVGVACSPEM